jgi:DNA-binding NtrC family response regulator
MQYQKQMKQIPDFDAKNDPMHPSQSLKNTYIAVIDDDAHILNATEKLLHSYGASVLTAKTPTQCWIEIENSLRVPDLFLVDHGLGQESGVDLIDLIHQQYGSKKTCILITGDTSAEHVEKFNQNKFFVLYKPMTDQALVEAIHQRLGLDK